MRLRRSGLWPHLSEEHRLARFRLGEVVAALGGGVAGGTVGIAGHRSGGVVLALALTAGVGSASLWRGRVDRATRRRRDRMCLELATINQMLAMWIRSGSGVAAAVRALCARGRGEVVGELGEALRLHHSGLALGEAFRRLAELTPEPHARRCYLSLATSDERGSDAATALLALADDIRADRRQALQREATRRRALMLLPVVAILGPILILFVAVPLPWIVLRSI